MDQFTLTKITMTPQLGDLMRQFRVSKNITAKIVAEKMQKTAGWISKQEKGVFDSIKVSDFSSYCSIVAGNDDTNGVRAFIESVLTSNKGYSSLSEETKNALDNIEDLIISFDVDPEMINDLRSYMKEKSITPEQLVEKVNQNADICNDPGYADMPKNIWTPNGIRLEIPEAYVISLLEGSIKQIHSVIIRGLFYAVFNLGGEDDPHRSTHLILDKYDILSQRFRYQRQKVHELHERLQHIDPEVKDEIDQVASFLAVVCALSPDYGKKNMRRIVDNMNMDRGFFFAYMSHKLTFLDGKTKSTKQEFLYRLQDLLKEFSEKDDSQGIEMYQ